MNLTFNTDALLEGLETADSTAIDELPFGVVGMTHDGIVARYNRYEVEHAGLEPGTVIGRHFFSEVAPCMNNHLVAARFENEANLDDVIEYVLAFRMKAAKVRLRLLKQSEHLHMFIAIERR